jgi:hypothetical protein
LLAPSVGAGCQDMGDIRLRERREAKPRHPFSARACGMGPSGRRDRPQAQS